MTGGRTATVYLTLLALRGPAGLLNLLAKLSDNAAKGQTDARVIKKHTETSDEELEDRIRTIFQRGNPGQFIGAMRDALVVAKVELAEIAVQVLGRRFAREV